MKKILLILVLWAIPAFAQFYDERHPGLVGNWNHSNKVDSIPPGALLAGYNTLTFNSTFVPSTVDTGRTYASGFSWYETNFTGSAPPNPITLNADGSATINGALIAFGGIQVATAAFTAPCCTLGSWVGTAFGGGAYFEATLKFDPTTVNIANGWPSFFADAIEYYAQYNQQWAGQVAGYTNHVEIDFLEYDTDRYVANSYGGTIHELYGVINVTCPGLCDVFGPSNVVIPTPGGFNWNTYHKIGFLWVPATVSTLGHASWYLDDRQVGQSVSWTQFTNQSPPPALGTASWTFGVVDQQHLVVTLGSGLNQPMTVQSVRVWQNNDSGNLVQ